MNGVLFTEEVKRLLLAGEFQAESVAPFSDQEDTYPPPPAQGIFKIENIELLRLKKNKFRLTFVSPSGVKIALFETVLRVDDSLTLDELDMNILMRLT